MALEGHRRVPPHYFDPMVVPPIGGKHAQSLIILHSRGSNGREFGLELLQTSIPDSSTIQNAFPNARFIFPTAIKRRAKIFKRIPIHQWFDNWSLQDPTEREKLQFEGLSEELGAMIGMCRWLPLRQRMEETLEDAFIDVDDDPFLRDEESQAGSTTINDTSQATFNISKMIRYLQDELEILHSDQPSRSTGIPVFIGHGVEDEKVRVSLAREATSFLGRVHIEVEHKEYKGLGHWYSGEMLCDIVNFISRQTE
ncbi:hypothetical protein K431DRAFT_152709 [Polychaeton citri CBS 116435]|uniref:Phospholipase/carboxylesterase/thioesterase domain-containing protein n=1 Tax=Polychaeton citri CBS 116435 TaxID=1314669 RepID=A0A9P4UL94_9PEZI|nr:hypothetical protein K431DRAFT_152709 [Polychaeton citri CBS 116435]